MHYYKFNIGDYASHTQHLDPLEDIAYRRMLDWLYLNEMKLPLDVEDIARLIRMRTHSECIAVVLREFFRSHSDGYTHVRVDKELAAYQERSDKAKKSAEARWKKNPAPAKESSDANALRTECDSNANHKPLTTNQEPLTINQKDKVKTLDQSAIDREQLDWCFEQFWISGIRKVNKKAAKPKFQKIITSMSKPDGPTIYDITNQLINDVKSRLSTGQLGFAEMHPTTYLNGERWNDELKQPEQQSRHEPPRSASERVRQAISEKQAARAAAAGTVGSVDREVVADAGGHVRPQVCEPIRGDSSGRLGEVLDGDFWPSDG
jgi:uncharacterized protein YdaU (DUF1376 family)